MSDSRVVTCSDCGTRMRMPEGKTKGRCPKCKLWMEYAPATTTSSEPATVAEPSAAIAVTVVAAPTVTVPSPGLVLGRTAAAGILLGMLLACGVWWARSGLGPMAPIAIVGLLSVIPILHVIVLLLRTPIPIAPGSPPTVSLSQRLLTFELAVLALPLLSLAGRSIVPDGGFASLIPAQRQRVDQGRAELARVSAEIEDTRKNFLKPQTHDVKKSPFDARRTEQEQAGKLAAIDPTPWREADFLLVNPTHYAVGIKDIGEPEKPKFQILSKAENVQAREAQKIAWENKTPIIGIDEPFTRMVYQQHAESETLEPVMLPRMLNLFETKPLLPANSTLVSYFDTVNNVQRVGHLLNEGEEEFEFCDLVPRRKGDKEHPFEIERILRAERVKPDSEQRNLNDLSLRSSTDLLDYFVYQILHSIQHSNRPLYQTGEPFVYVNRVQADITEYGERLNEIYSRRDSASEELRMDYGAGQKRSSSGGDPHPVNRLIEVFSRVILDREDELSSRSVMMARRKELTAEIQELKRQIAQLRSLINAEKRLTSEIRSRLLRAGIKQVEREENALTLIHSERGRWDKPKSDEAIDTKLSVATHLLLTEIRTPDQSGRYQLSMRVVDVLKGEILWEDQGDRQDLNPSSPSAMDVYTLSGTWKTRDGDRVDILEAADGSLRASITTANGQITYEISAKRMDRAIIVESCTASLQRGPKTYRSTVRAEVRVLEDDVLEIACPSVGVNKSRLIAGDMVRSRFQKLE